MNIEGVVLLDRAMARHEVWDAPFMRSPSEPFCKRAAWVDLLLLANTSEAAFTKRGRAVELSRGQVGWSKKGLADRWAWSVTKVTGFLAWLEQRGMVRVETVDKLTTIITITNYGLYQGALEALAKEAEGDRKEFGNGSEGTPKENGKFSEGNREGVGEGEGSTKTPRREGEGVGTRTLTSAAETDGVPSVAEVRTWAQMSGVDPDWAEDRHGYVTERNGWVVNGCLLDWRRMFKRWSERNKVAVPKNAAPEKNAAPVSDERLRSALSALSAQAAETAELNRVRTEDGDVS